MTTRPSLLPDTIVQTNVNALLQNKFVCASVAIMNSSLVQSDYDTSCSSQLEKRRKGSYLSTRSARELDTATVVIINQNIIINYLWYWRRRNILLRIWMMVLDCERCCWDHGRWRGWYQSRRSFLPLAICNCRFLYVRRIFRF